MVRTSRGVPRAADAAPALRARHRRPSPRTMARGTSSVVACPFATPAGRPSPRARRREGRRRARRASACRRCVGRPPRAPVPSASRPAPAGRRPARTRRRAGSPPPTDPRRASRVAASWRSNLFRGCGVELEGERPILLERGGQRPRSLAELLRHQRVLAAVEVKPTGRRRTAHDAVDPDLGARWARCGSRPRPVRGAARPAAPPRRCAETPGSSGAARPAPSARAPSSRRSSSRARPSSPAPSAQAAANVPVRAASERCPCSSSRSRCNDARSISETQRRKSASRYARVSLSKSPARPARRRGRGGPAISSRQPAGTSARRRVDRPLGRQVSDHHHRRGLVQRRRRARDLLASNMSTIVSVRTMIGPTMAPALRDLVRRETDLARRDTGRRGPRFARGELQLSCQPWLRCARWPPPPPDRRPTGESQQLRWRLPVGDDPAAITICVAARRRPTRVPTSRRSAKWESLGAAAVNRRRLDE